MEFMGSIVKFLFFNPKIKKERIKGFILLFGSPMRKYVLNLWNMTDTGMDKPLE
jgi:hypothetical protein